MSLPANLFWVTAVITAAVTLITYAGVQKQKFQIPVILTITKLLIMTSTLFFLCGFNLLSIRQIILVMALNDGANNDRQNRKVDAALPVFILVAGLISRTKDDFFMMCLGGVAVFLLLFGISYFSGIKALGGGDVKLISAAAFFFGGLDSIVLLFFTAFFAVILFYIYRFRGKLSSGKKIPFVPALEYASYVTALVPHLLNIII